MTNLRNAFPEKSEAEIEAIALESWGSIGRLAAEYVFLDELFDFDPANPQAGPHRGLGHPAVRGTARQSAAVHRLHRP